MQIFKFILSKHFLTTLIKAVLTVVVIVLLTWLLLRYYTKHGEQVLVPNVTNMNLENAVKELNKNGLGYTLIDSTFVKGKEGLIYAQIPEDSSFVKTEREIYLKIYRRIPPEKSIRFKIGEPLEIARTKLLSKGFEVETKYQAGEFDNVILGAYHGDKELIDGDMVGMGEKIKLIVSEKKTTEVTLPNLRNMTLDQAKTALSEVSLNIDFPIYHQSVLTKSDSAIARIYKQLPKYSEGQRIRAGSTVNVWLTNESIPNEIEPGESPLDTP